STPTGNAERLYAMFMTTSTAGINMTGSPTDSARSTKKASLNRANAKIVATPTTSQNARPNAPTLLKSANVEVGRLSFRGGSFTVKTITATEMTAGTTATQKTRV